MKALCKVKGMVRPGAVCGFVIVGMKYCGHAGECEYKQPEVSLEPVTDSPLNMIKRRKYTPDGRMEWECQLFDMRQNPPEAVLPLMSEEEMNLLDARLFMWRPLLEWKGLSPDQIIADIKRAYAEWKGASNA